jgi:hypothetical protein
MAEQAHSSTETGESEHKEKMQIMMFEFMKELKQEFQEMRVKREQDREQCNSRMDKRDEKLEKLQREIKQDLKEECQQMRERISGDSGNKNEIEQEKESAKVTEQTNEKVIPTETNVTKSKKHKIRRVCVLKSCDINLTKFRKQVRKTKLGQASKFNNSDSIKCKRNTPTNHKNVKTKRTNTNKVKNNEVFRTNPNKSETKVFRSRHENLNRKQASGFTKTNTCVELTRRLGERNCSKLNSCKGKLNLHNEQLSDSIKCQIVNRKSKHKISLEKQRQECTNCQMIECLFQKEINLTKSTKKLGTNWPELDNGRAINRKIPFKMKRKVVVKTKKMRVRMKEITNRNRFGKPKWKIKLEI